jgi:hypothetical protein
VGVRSFMNGSHKAIELSKRLNQHPPTRQIGGFLTVLTKKRPAQKSLHTHAFQLVRSLFEHRARDLEKRRSTSLAPCFVKNLKVVSLIQWDLTPI